jgi:hypothetical protein
VDTYTKLQLYTLLQELLAFGRVGQRVIVTDCSDKMGIMYTFKKACAKALGVHQGSIAQGRLLKKGRYAIRLAGPIALSMKITSTHHLYFNEKALF